MDDGKVQSLVVVLAAVIFRFPQYPHSVACSDLVTPATLSALVRVFFLLS